MRALTIATALLALSACGVNSTAPVAPPSAVGTAPTAAGPPNVAPLAGTDAAPPLQTVTVPGQGQVVPMPEFVGQWAVSDAQCGAPDWRFTRDSLTHGATTCSFTAIGETAHGYDVQAMCGGAPAHLQIASRSRPRRSLTVIGAPGESETELIFCAN